MHFVAADANVYLRNKWISFKNVFSTFNQSAIYISYCLGSNQSHENKDTAMLVARYNSHVIQYSFVPYNHYQHGRRDVMCNPAISSIVVLENVLNYKHNNEAQMDHLNTHKKILNWQPFMNRQERLFCTQFML